MQQKDITKLAIQSFPGPMKKDRKISNLFV